MSILIYISFSKMAFTGNSRLCNAILQTAKPKNRAGRLKLVDVASCKTKPDEVSSVILTCFKFYLSCFSIYSCCEISIWTQIDKCSKNKHLYKYRKSRIHVCGNLIQNIYTKFYGIICFATSDSLKLETI